VNECRLYSAGGLMNLYESGAMQKVLGETLRPGGTELTKRALEYCRFKSGDRILDLGCGTGATIKCINDFYDFHVTGLDISEKLAAQAGRLNPGVDIVVVSAENTTFENSAFDGVLAECTLSLMDNLEKSIEEINRITRRKGWLIISDVYVKNTEYMDELKKLSVGTCLKRPHDLKNLRELLNRNRFNMLILEEHDNLLLQLLADIIFEYGSMDKFWEYASGSSIDGKSFQNILKKSKLGYFLLIACKE
jgi:ubiquinone/menaquinone biosynthesis C-methylase UbiE